MRVCVYMAIHGRPDITSLVIKNILSQTMTPIRVIVVGSDPEDRKTGDLIDVDYLDHPNNPVGYKLQYGLDHCRKYDPDAVMVCDSDDFLSPNWIEIFCGFLSKYDVIINNNVYTLRVFPLSLLYTIGLSYLHTGRLISKRILEKSDWKIYPSKNTQTGGLSQAVLKKNGGTLLRYNDDKTKCLSVKGPWKVVTTWEAMKKQHSIEIKNPRVWIENNFPQVVSLLGKNSE